MPTLIRRKDGGTPFGRRLVLIVVFIFSDLSILLLTRNNYGRRLSLLGPLTESGHEGHCGRLFRDHTDFGETRLKKIM